MPRRKRSHITRYYGAQNPYLLHDEFITARSAGAVNGTLAETGPGVRRVTDTGNVLAIDARRRLYLGTAGNAFQDPDLYYTPASPVGAVLFGMHHSGSAEEGPYFVVSPTDRPADPTATGLGFYQQHDSATGRLYVSPAKLQISKPETLTGVYYYLYLIRRTGGGALFIVNGGIYSNQLLWVEDTDDIVSDTYVGIDDYFGTGRIALLEAVASNKLEAAFLSKYGSCVSADTFTRADGADIGATEIGAQTWVEIDAGASISGNTLTSPNNGGAIVNLGQQPRILDLDVVVPAGGGISAAIYFRCGANGLATNTLLYCAYGTGGIAKANNVSIGQSGIGALTAGQTNRIRVVDFGDHVRCYTNGILVVDVANSENVDAAHYYAGVYTYTGAAGYGLDNWRCYPATIALPTVLATAPAAVAGSGAAILSDDMTDADATELSAHNAAWTVINSAPYVTTWEINTNKARLTADGAVGLAVTDAGTVDHEIACNIFTPNTEPADDGHEWFCGLAVRYTDLNNRLWARLIYSSGRECELWENVGGVSTLISMTKLPGLLAKNTTYAMKMAVKGNQVCVYLGGKLINQVRTNLATGTKCGLISDGTGGDAGNRPTWDDVVVKAVT